MGQMTHYVDHEQIQNGINKIQSFMNESESTSSKISTELESLKNSININSKHPENKAEEVARGMRNLKNSNNTTIAVFNHVIEIYFQAKANSVSYIRNQTGELSKKV